MACGGCGMTYQAFRTGLSFAAVRELLWSHSEDSSDWPKGVTRRTVLGRWRQWKLEAWEQHLRQCEEVPF